jgi:uncharacterized RDD family membrane protein YckC
VQTDNLEYVGFWPRLGASIIDILLQLMITLALTFMFYGRLAASPPGQFFGGFADLVINYMLPAAIVIAFWVCLGATPGKMAMSAQIVDADSGERLTTGQSVIRYLGYIVSAVPFGVGFLWVAFDRKKQGWHDKMANSVVVRPRGQEPVRFAGPKGGDSGRIEPGL